MKRLILVTLLCLVIVPFTGWSSTVYIDPTCATPGDGSTQRCSGTHAPLNAIPATFTASTTYLGKAGTVAYGAFTINAANVTIGSYGTGTFQINGSQNVSGPGTVWTQQSSPNKNVYAISYTLPTHGVAMVWQNSTRLTSATVQSIAGVQARAGSFYYTAGTMYMQPAGSTNPNTDGNLYELPSQCYNIWDNGHAGLHVSNVEGVKTSCDSTTMGGLYFQGKGGYVSNSSFHNHARHALGFYVGSTNCEAIDMTLSDAWTTAVVSFYGRGTSTNLLTSSVRGKTTINNLGGCTGGGTAGGAIIIHGSGSGSSQPNHSKIQNVAITGDCGATGTIQVYDGLNTIIEGVTFTGTYQSQLIYSYLTTTSGLTIHNNVFNPTSVAASKDWVFLQDHTGISVLHNTFSGTGNGRARIRWYTTATRGVVKNNVAILSNASDTFLNVAATAQSGFVSDYNNVYTTVSSPWGTWGSTSCTSLANWTGGTCNTGNDAHSITSNPLPVISSNGNITFSLTSPAINAGTSTVCSILATLSDPNGVPICVNSAFPGPGWAPSMGAYQPATHHLYCDSTGTATASGISPASPRNIAACANPVGKGIIHMGVGAGHF